MKVATVSSYSNKRTVKTPTETEETLQLLISAAVQLLILTSVDEVMD